jgi:hypothetical protein
VAECNGGEGKKRDRKGEKEERQDQETIHKNERERERGSRAESGGQLKEGWNERSRNIGEEVRLKLNTLRVNI